MNKCIAGLEKLVKIEYANIAGIVVLKNGERAYEGYFDGFTAEDSIHVTSVTKSLMSALLGIAIDKGYIESVDQKVLDFFPDYVLKRGEKTIQDVTIKNMLTMTAPYKYKSEPYTKVYTSGDWTKAALDLLGGKSGITGEFKYSTVGTQVLSGILVRATGKTVIEFAAESLFEPLGIKVPRNRIIRNKEEHMAFLQDRRVSGWVVDPKGVNTAGWGLCLAPRDMAKIGQLYLNDGLHNGERIISSEWIQESTKEKSRREDFSYGYLWWIIDSRHRRAYAAIGDGGNMIFVDPEKRIVVAIAARFMQKSKNPIELVKERIVPLFE